MNVSRALPVLVLPMLAAVAQRPASKTYRLTGGWWFDGSAFVRKNLYIVNGTFRDRAPAKVDSVVDLGDAYIVPPFADAHSHAFTDLATIDAVVRQHLEHGIFYGLSLTGSAKGKRSVADKVNRPSSIDVAYAEALTATRGHPIMSAEVTANGFSWDSLRAYWPRLLKSKKAEGDVYFVIDSLPDLERKWPRILANRPDIIKIYLMDSEHFDELRRDTTSLDKNGLDPLLVLAIVQRAHRSRLRVAAHVETAADFRVAVAAGVDIIAHLPGLAPGSKDDPRRYAIAEADAALAAKNGTAVVPTAWLAQRLAAPKPWLTGAAAAADTAQLGRAQRIQRQSLEVLARHRVRIGIGSDLFEDATAEADYLYRLGVFDTRMLLGLWSRTTAEIVFPKRKIGRLEAGYEASFLALACDPLTDFGCTKKITRLVKQGVVLPAK